jgi:hypothetical protein
VPSTRLVFAVDFRSRSEIGALAAPAGANRKCGVPTILPQLPLGQALSFTTHRRNRMIEGSGPEGKSALLRFAAHDSLPVAHKFTASTDELPEAHHRHRCLFVAMGSMGYARPAHEGSEDCYRHGHRMYVPVGLNYPRAQLGSWGITCRSAKTEGTEAAETATGADSRPAQWCGWWMRQHLGGHYGPEFNTAINWLRVGRPLDDPRPGAIGIQAHHVFQVVRVVGPGEVLAISGNDHGAVRTRIRSTAAVIGWRQVEEGATTPNQVYANKTRISANPIPGTGDTAPEGDY